ncbi:MAG: MFS transporter [Chloroflexota bacterium]
MRWLTPVVVYVLLKGILAFLLATIFTVAPLYRINEVGMKPLQLMLVGMVLEAAAFLFEIPTGIVADTYSRKLSIIIGVCLMGVASVLEGLVPVLGPILVAQAIWGIGFTFTSGATDAWMVDEIGEERSRQAFVRAAQIAQIGTLVGIVFGTGLGSMQLNLPIWVGGFLMIGLGLLLIIIMPETGFHPTPHPERSSWEQMRRTFVTGTQAIRTRPILITILTVGTIVGASGEGLDRLWQYHFETSFRFPTVGELTPIIWFGMISVMATLLSIVAAERINRHMSEITDRSIARTLLVIDSMRLVSILLFALAGNFFLAIAAFCTTSALRTINGPLYAVWLNRNIPSSVRSTVLSMNGQIDSLGQIAGGPVFGAIGNVSIRLAIGVVGLVIGPALALYWRTAYTKKKAL